MADPTRGRGGSAGGGRPPSALDRIRDAFSRVDPASMSIGANPGGRGAVQAAARLATEGTKRSEAFWANSIRNQLTGDYSTYDPELTYSGAYEAVGLPSPVAQTLGTMSMVGEPGPGEVLDALRVASPALAAALPRELLDRLAGVTKAVDDEGRPVRTLHGTTDTYDAFDVAKTNPETLFGRGHYSTEGYYPGRGHPRPMDVWDDQPLPYDPTLELTTDRYARANRAGRGATPQVRLNYLDTRNPFDFNEVATNPEALGTEMIRALGLTGTRARQAQRNLEAALGDVTSHPTFGDYGHPGRITNGDVMFAVQSAVSGWGGGYVPEAAKGVYQMGHDAIRTRSNIPGSPVYTSGPTAWHVPTNEQVVPAGDVPRALQNLIDRGVVHPEDEIVKQLAEQYRATPDLSTARRAAPQAPAAPVQRRTPPAQITHDNEREFVESIVSDPALREEWEQHAKEFWNEGTTFESVARYPLSLDLDVWDRPVPFDVAVDEVIDYLTKQAGFDQQTVLEAIDRSWDYDEIWNR